MAPSLDLLFGHLNPLQSIPADSTNSAGYAQRCALKLVAQGYLPTTTWGLGLFAISPLLSSTGIPKHTRLRNA